jgi:perosamine synthetase
MPIPLSSPDITDAEIAAVTAVLRTPHLCFGPELTAFEEALASYVGAPHAVAVSSGTAGLHLALITLKIGAGDEVIVPSFAFIAVANTLHQSGAIPVFVEIDPITLNLAPAAVERAITPRTRAILVVHTFGVPAEMDALVEIARRHHLLLIEDACEALGGDFGEGTSKKRCGSFGDLAVFGFYPNKQITTGEGGAVIAHDPVHAVHLRSLRNQGSQPGGGWYNNAEQGYNYRLSDLACALGRVQLSRIEEILTLRRQAAERYDALLRPIPGLELPPLALPRRTISWFVYVVRLPEGVDGDRVKAALALRGIAASRYFAPIHHQPAWRRRPSARLARLPLTEALAPRTLALPFFNRITAGQQAEVAAALGEILASRTYSTV